MLTGFVTESSHFEILEVLYGDVCICGTAGERLSRGFCDGVTPMESYSYEEVVQLLALAEQQGYWLGFDSALERLTISELRQLLDDPPYAPWCIPPHKLHKPF